MQALEVKSGVAIITQGDLDAVNFYVVKSGGFDVVVDANMHPLLAASEMVLTSTPLPEITISVILRKCYLNFRCNLREAFGEFPKSN